MTVISTSVCLIMVWLKQILGTLKKKKGHTNTPLSQK